jgi:hypothetical protein
MNAENPVRIAGKAIRAAGKPIRDTKHRVRDCERCVGAAKRTLVRVEPPMQRGVEQARSGERGAMGIS